MSKKKLIILPIVAIILAFMGVSVFAAPSPYKGIKVEDKNGHDVTGYFTVTSCSKIDLSSIDGLQKKIDAVNNKLKVKDFKHIVSYDVQPKAGYNIEYPCKVTVLEKIPKGNVGIVVHDGRTVDVNVFKGSGTYATISNINSFSPFSVYYAKPSSSPQTGDYAPVYIAAIGAVLLCGGVFFAIRAKKASK